MPAVSHRARHNARSSCPTPARAVEERMQLRATIRQCKAAMSGSLLSMTTPTFYSPPTLMKPKWTKRPSPIKVWQGCKKQDYSRAKAQAERQLKALEEIYPTPPWFKVRPATAADKRIAKQYDPEATPLHECVLINVAGHDARAAFRKSWRYRFSDSRRLLDRIRLADVGIVVNDGHDPYEACIEQDREERWSEELAKAREQSVAA